MKRIYNLQFTIYKVVFIALLYILHSTLFITTAQAQTIDPNTWQTGATGLRTTSNTERMTAGLSTMVKASGVPFMSLQGGVKYAGWGGIIGPTTIDLGEVKPFGTTPSLTSQTADWAHNQMSFSSNLDIWISRLTPALLVQNLNNSLRIFSGNLNGGIITTGSVIGEPWLQVAVQNRNPAPVFPKYIAYQSQGAIIIQAIPASGASALPLPSLDNNWILVWYGSNSYFVDTKKPITYSGITDNYTEPTLPVVNAYQADAPILLKFQNAPASIKQTTEGGIDLIFTENSGYSSIMPLLGRDHPKASVTESWYDTSKQNNNNLPSDILTKINFWVTGNRLCSYPTQVTESYAYDAGSDTAQITDNITYLNVCTGGSTNQGFATIPPALSLAKNSFGTNFNITGTLIDASYPTEFGPIQGIDNANSYTWSLSGLKKYTDSERIFSNGSVPQELVQELTSEVDKITQAGHLAPWVVKDAAQGDLGGPFEFANPGDNIYYLSRIVSILPEPQKTNLVNYLESERTNYPPETIYNLPLTEGVARGDYSLPLSRVFYGQTYAQRWQQNRPDVFLKRVPLNNFYALADYYNVTGVTIPDSLLTSAALVLNSSMSELDWANLYWFKNFEQREIAVENVNKHFAGLVGLVKIAQKTNNSQIESLSRSLLAKAAVVRIAFLEYPSYLYSTNIIDLTSFPANWQPLQLTQDFYGYIVNYNWQNANDDARQMLILNQFESYLNDHSGTSRNWTKATNAQLIAFKGMVPELFRLLTDYDKTKAEIYIKKYETYNPSWYLALDMAQIGTEHGASYPGDSLQLFMAKALLQKDTPENLARYTSFPWLNTGDLFYMHKLAETIKAYQGWKWEDEAVDTGIPADLNNDTQVNVLDIQACVNHILGIQDLGSRADVNGDGSVNVLDVQVIVNIILGV